jgi:hypothetical protein
MHSVMDEVQFKAAASDATGLYTQVTSSVQSLHFCTFHTMQCTIVFVHCNVQCVRYPYQKSYKLLSLQLHSSKRMSIHHMDFNKLFAQSIHAAH